MKNIQKEIFTFQQCLGTLKRQYFEKIKWGNILSYVEQFTNFIFWLSKKIAFCIYGEYA